MSNKLGDNVQKIQAAVLRNSHAPIKIEIVDLEGPRDDEVLVRIVTSGICHTDISFVDDWDERDDPVVLGHEGAGIVERVGKLIKDVKRGDHVVLSYQSCGKCRACKNESPADCKIFYELNFGFERPDGSNAMHRNGVRGHFFGQSSFATYVLATERNIVKVLKKLDLKILAPLGCGLQTGAGTVMNSLKVKKGASIAVFGTGSVGLAAIMAARVVGAKPIIGIDIVPARLRLAKEMGATHVINSQRENVKSRINTITGTGIDFTVETSGDTKMHRLSMDLLNPCGTAAFLTGISGPASLAGGRKTISVIQGDAVPQRFIPKLISLYRAGKFPFDRMLKFYKFSDINKAIADSKRGKTIKPVLCMS